MFVLVAMVQPKKQRKRKMEYLDTQDIGTMCDKWGQVIGYRAKTRRGELILRQASYRYAEKVADMLGDLNGIGEAEDSHQRYLDFLAVAM